MSDNGKKSVDLENLKTGGFIKERGKDLFTVRLRVPGGNLDVARVKDIAEVALQHGVETMHLSVRQSLELCHVDYRKFDDLVRDLEAKGQKIASCGARVRVPTACGGCGYNPNGIMDTQASANEVDQNLFGTATGHHKLKTSFSGCPIDCFKSYFNDVGFQGAVYPQLDLDACIGCGLCAKSCGSDAIRMEDGKPVFNADNCIYCGDCIKACPTEAWTAKKKGYMVRIGGKGGHNPMLGTVYAEFLPAERVIEFIQEVLAWYQEKGAGLGRTRIATILEREGTDSLLDHLRVKFPENVPESTLLPQVVNTQMGKHRKKA
jgi:anaerobic sulfite reductase subunit C